MFIEVSHESPISILDKSLTYNDYAYALVHLFDSHPEYYKFYKNLVDTTDVPVLLDNSIFELKKAFDPSKYAEWIDKLQPNYYIVPDVLESCPDTIQHWKRWCTEYETSTEALRIGVVQGRDWNELVRCYNFMKDQAEYIAISFDYSYYTYTGLVEDDYASNDLVRWCSGRKRFIRQLIDEGYKINRIVNYRSIHSENFSEKFIDELKLNMPDIVYIYSQNSASNFLKFIKIYQSENLWMNTNLMCIGEKTSAILNEIKWKKIFLFNPGEEEFLLYKI